jgi:hypothetical protein
MDNSRLILNIGFWIIFTIVFDPVSSFLFPNISWDMQLWLWFIGLCLGTLIFNLCWYWIRLRQH